MVAEAKSVRAAPTLSTSFSPTQVTGCHPEQFLTPGRPDRLDRGNAIALPAGGGVHLRLQLGQRPRSQLLIICEHLHCLRSPLQQLDGVPARSQNPGQSLGHRALVAKGPQIPGGSAQRLRHLAECQQTMIRIGRCANQPSIAGNSWR